MNPNTPEDRLLDELLHEQHHGPDEAFLRQIEAAVDAGPLTHAKRPKRHAASRIAIAAAVTLAAGGAFWWQTRKPDRSPLAINDSRAATEQMKAAEQLADLNKAIRDQEDKVEERRKVLATIAKTKDIVYAAPDSPKGQPAIREEAIKKGLDAQDYVDARREFDADQDKLQAMKLQQSTLAGASGAEFAKDEIPPPPAGTMPQAYSAAPTQALDSESLAVIEEAEANARERGNTVLPDEVAGVLKRVQRSNVPATGGGAGAIPEHHSEIAALEKTRAPAQPARSFNLDGRSGDAAPRPSAVPMVGRLFRDHEPTTGDRYGTFIDQPWKTSASEPLSTFSIDVDTASYGNVRRMIREGREIPRDAVRIEECINAFSYRYAPPKGDAAFAVGASLAACPWAPEHQLVRIAIKGREIDAAKRPASNLVFLIDVSGSMQSPDKLPLLKQSMANLVEQLDERDRVAIVVYAGNEGVALPSTRLDAEGRAAVLRTLSKLEAGGSTNGGAGINRAYELAAKQKVEGGVNRVILATDGDFNVGVTGQSSLVELVKDRAKSGVYLTVLGFGTGNLNDAMMDAITRDGNGNYFYIDSEREGRKVFLQNLTGTLVTIAKDVKIQIEFNPAKVGAYRLIGYANRVLRNEDFSNDKVDAGDIGAGHTVTAFYELMPPGTANASNGLKYQPVTQEIANNTNEWLTVNLRHKHPEGDQSSLTEFALTGAAAALDQMEPDYQFATAVALFGMKLRGMDETRGIPWDRVLALAKAGLADDANEDRAEFVELVRKLGGTREEIAPPPAEVVPQSDR